MMFFSVVLRVHMRRLFSAQTAVKTSSKTDGTKNQTFECLYLSIK